MPAEGWLADEALSGNRLVDERAADPSPALHGSHFQQLAVLGDRAARDLQALADRVRAFLAGASAPEGYQAFDGVAGHAGRHVCVLLPLEAALKALEG